jgi:hypothetical protein
MPINYLQIDYENKITRENLAVIWNSERELSYTPLINFNKLTAEFVTLSVPLSQCLISHITEGCSEYVYKGLQVVLS